MYRLLLFLLCASCVAMTPESQLTRRNGKINGHGPQTVHMKQHDALRVFDLLDRNCRTEPDESHPIEINNKTRKQALSEFRSALSNTNIDSEFEKMENKRTCRFCLKFFGTACCCGCVGGCMLMLLALKTFPPCDQ